MKKLLLFVLFMLTLVIFLRNKFININLYDTYYMISYSYVFIITIGVASTIYFILKRKNRQ